MEGEKEFASLGSRSRLQLTDTQEVEFSVHADSVQVSTFQKKMGRITILGEVQQKQDKSMITLHIFCNNHKCRWKRWRAGWRQRKSLQALGRGQGGPPPPSWGERGPGQGRLCQLTAERYF